MYQQRKLERKHEEGEFEVEWDDSPAAQCVEEDDCKSWVKAFLEQEQDLKAELVECGTRTEKQVVNKKLRRVQYFLQHARGGFVRATWRVLHAQGLLGTPEREAFESRRAVSLSRLPPEEEQCKCEQGAQGDPIHKQQGPRSRW